MLKLVTITGADGSIKPSDLIALSIKYPFVEWGILISRRSMGTNRFPSMDWLEQLLKEKEIHRDKLRLSCHLCGAYVREFVATGATEFIKELGPVWNVFDRVQINTHGQVHEIDTAKIIEAVAANESVEFIFQNDGLNSNIILPEVKDCVDNFSTLFDLSHGAGILPEKWPTPVEGVKCGYAGVLSPANLRDQIINIETASGGNDYWVDMETHVRSEEDKLFDLAKVEICLEIASEFVGN